MGFNPDQPRDDRPPQVAQESFPYTSPEAYMQPPVQQPPSTASEQATYGQQPPPYAPQFYGPPGAPPFVPQPPQQKRSLKWLWITLGILGGLIVLSCIGCFIVGGLSIGTIRQIISPAIVTGEYYQYVQSQQYDKAYGLLASNATITVQGAPVQNTQDAYVQAAESLDQKYGAVSGVRMAQVDSTDLSHITITVSRGKYSYDVHMTFTGSGSNAKIVSIDGI